MSIKEKDINLLWGRSANRCSFPDCRMKLSQDKKMASESFPIGEQAHIVGKEEGSARSVSILSEEERDSYHNLILLCPTHHTLIDKNPEDYPIEKLHMIKAQHEYWVESTLSESHETKAKASDIIYAHLIDLTVEGCSFENWESWMNNLISPSHRIVIDTYMKAIQFTLSMHKAVWPGNLHELESAMKHFSTTMNIMLNFYIKNAESRGDYYIVDKFYKKRYYPQEIYQQFLDKYEKWEGYLDELIYEVVKAANWLADIRRRDINPLFMATKGKFFIVIGPDDNLSYQTVVPEYSIDQKKELIDSFEDKCRDLANRAASIDI